MSPVKENDRAPLLQAKRLVVKIGSRVLVQANGRPDTRRIKNLVKQLIKAKKGGRELILVSSGAIASGMESLGIKARPKDLAELQMAAAVGQVRLMGLYEKFFAEADLKVGQVLLTHEDMQNRVRHLNARNTMLSLLKHNVIPIVNENDVIAVDEIKFGDNDLLASLVSLLIDADLLILLTTADGFHAPDSAGRMKRVPVLKRVSAETLKHAKGKGSKFSTGGMASKLQSAQLFSQVGGQVVIAHGAGQKIILRILAGADVGTFIKPVPLALHPRKKWIAFFNRARGSLVIDRGAARALQLSGRSLLPIGVKAVEGRFEQGAVVNVKSETRELIARGLVSFSSEQIQRIKGKKSSEIPAILGSVDLSEVIHCDNMVLLSPATTEEQ